MSAFYKGIMFFRLDEKALAKDGEGAGRGPCGLRNSELGPRPRDVHFYFSKRIIGEEPLLILF